MQTLQLMNDQSEFSKLTSLIFLLSREMVNPKKTKDD